MILGGSVFYARPSHGAICSARIVQREVNAVTNCASRAQTKVHQDQILQLTRERWSDGVFPNSPPFL